MNTINRKGRKKRELRNLMRRKLVWYFKKTVNGRTKPVSLNTEDLELAKSKRDAMEKDALNQEWEKIQGPRAQTAGTLDDVFNKYEAIGGITHKAIIGNQSAMMCLVRGALGDEKLKPVDVRLDVLTKKMMRDYQDNLRKRYEAAAGTEEKARRMARDRADRTSKSTFNQAKSIFSLKRDMIDRYKEAGIAVPDCVKEFAGGKAKGSMSTKQYFPPSELMMKQTFEKVEDLRSTDPETYFLFWAALATGCRRNELADMLVTDLVEIDGRLWVGAGLGKDGEQIRIPVINFVVHTANPRTPASVLREMLQERKSGPLFLGDRRERYDEMPDRLNGWLNRMGWTDEKKLHAIRGFIGSKLYSKNTHLARLYLRHKSIATTEKYYGAFFRLNEVFAFAADDAPAPAPATAVVAAPPGPPVLTIVQASGQVAA